MTVHSVVAPSGAYAVKAGVVFLQVKLCDPHLSALEVRFSYDEALYKSTFTFTFTQWRNLLHC